MKKLLLSVFVMCAMCEASWSKTERICVAPAGCPIVMNTGECPTCIDKLISEIKIKINKVERKSVIKKVKWKCNVGSCNDWIDSNGNLIVKK
tara:strand:+ start:6079 stop:6354 length:276 start_codon:yes stop_codon:yes gene_type:complete